MIAVGSKISKRLPGYKQVEHALRDRIGSGTWPVGSTLPNRRELAAEFGVPVGTVQQAVSSMLQDGTLHASTRTGTVVARLSNPTTVERSQSDLASSSSNMHKWSGRQTIGVVAGVEDLDQAVDNVIEKWPITVLRGFEAAFADESAVTLRFQGRPVSIETGEPLALADAIAQITAEHLDGLAVLYPPDDEVDEIVRLTDAMRVPTVFVRHEFPIERPVPHIIYDSAFAGYQAGQHLVERGYTNISFFCPFDVEWTLPRVAGIRQAIIAAKIAPNSFEVSPVDSSIDPRSFEYLNEGVEFARRLLATRRDRWGIVAANDHLANAIYLAGRELGLVMGQDYGLVGFDDWHLSREIGATTLQPPLSQMGAEAARMLIHALRGHRMPTQVRLRWNLIARDSTRGLNL